MTQLALELQEYVPRDFARDQLDERIGEFIWERYRKYVDIEFPSPKTGQRWRLTPRGVVGFLPLGDECGLVIRPKVPVANLFRMLQHAYGLDSFQFLAGTFTCASLEEFYAFLAGELAARVLRRVRRGLSRDYVQLDELLQSVRGRLDVVDRVRNPWRTHLRCHFDEQTLDVEDNRLLAWALFLAARTVTGPPATQALVRSAFRALSATVEVAPCRSAACVGRSYDRLSLDYAPMHALAAFVIDHSGPEHARGDRTMLPFVVDMSRLFERFVSSVLANHAGSRASVHVQERVHPAGDGVVFVLDILVRDANGEVVRVVDMKYKDVPVPSPDDVAQVVAYATAVGAREAVLVYPRPMTWAAPVGPVLVRTVGVPLEDDLRATEKTIASLLRPEYTRDEVRAAMGGRRTRQGGPTV